MSSSEYALQLPDGSGPVPIGLLDAAAADKIRALLERSETVEVRLSAASDDDTAGHEMSAGSVVVQATFGDDVEGHAFSLRFTNAAGAADFQKKLIATGAMAATIAAAAVGAGILAQSVPANPAGDVAPVFAAPDRPADWDAAHHMGVASGTQQAPGIYYSASSAESGIREDVQASVPQAPGIYYSASSAESGIQVGVVDGAIQLGGGATEEALPDQTNLRGTDKSLPGV
jgi:hypothetical protein